MAIVIDKEKTEILGSLSKLPRTEMKVSMKSDRTLRKED